MISSKVGGLPFILDMDPNDGQSDFQAQTIYDDQSFREVKEPGTFRHEPRVAFGMVERESSDGSPCSLDECD